MHPAINSQSRADLIETSELQNNVLNTVAHEMRTPLTSIVGHVELLEDEIGGPLTRAQRNYLEQVRFGAERLQKQIDDMLDFAKLESGTFVLQHSTVNVFTIASQVAKSFIPSANKSKVSINVLKPNTPIKAQLDRDRIVQVLTNLISNALKYSPVGGCITIAIVQTTTHVVFEIYDEGPGIAEEHQIRIFDKFYQVRDKVLNRKGTGLGLAISRAVVEAHGGMIGVLSQVGQGSKFWFTIPN